MHRLLSRVTIAGAATVAATAGLALPAHAVPPPSSQIYVNATSSSPSGADTSCDEATHSTIQSAVDDVANGGSVFVCAGTYAEEVTIGKTLALRGVGRPLVDATGQPYGIGIAANYVTVDGFDVQNAASATLPPFGDGIVTAGYIGGTDPTDIVVGNHATVTGNRSSHNANSGIDIISSSRDVVSHNLANHNGIGINVVNDLGQPSAHNTISDNDFNHNPEGCGIVLADHTGVGIFANEVTGNTANSNGLASDKGRKSSGSGIILAVGTSDGAGFVSDNLIKGNGMTGNGHAGVALHGHSPKSKFEGNSIVNNTIGRNNLRYDYKDSKTTGIYLGTAGSLTIHVARNFFHDVQVGVFSAGDVTINGKSTNGFRNVPHHFVHIANYAG